MSINPELYDTRTYEWTDIYTLKSEAIDHIIIDESALSTRHHSYYSEHPSRYKVMLVGEKRYRRVYAKAIGNVSVVFIKSSGKFVHCETAMDVALYKDRMIEK